MNSIGREYGINHPEEFAEKGQIVDWKFLSEQFLASIDPEQKTRLALDIGTDFGVIPEARTWLSDYLSTPEARTLPKLCLSFLLGSFLGSPSKREVEIANSYWNQENLICLDVAGGVILNGANSLTQQERFEYAQKARSLYGEIKNATGAYNLRAQLVVIVAEFEESEATDWLCGILKHDTVGPAPGNAFNYGVNYDAKRVVEALLINLRNIEKDHLHGKAWVIAHLLYVLGEFGSQEDLRFLANSIVEMVSTNGEDFDVRYPREVVVDAVRREKEKVKSALSRLPANYFSRKAILALLPNK